MQKEVDKNSREYIWKSLLAGGVSGCVAKSFTAPLDRVKILFQGFNPVYKGHIGTPFAVFRAAKHIYETHGVRGLYQGHSAMLLRIFPSAAIRFMSYEQLKQALIPSPEYNSPLRHFLAGSLAGNLGVLSTYPLEVVRSRLAYEIRSEHHKNWGIRSMSLQIYRENGNSLRGFYKGFGATMCGVVPYAGAAFMSYHYMKDYLMETFPDETTYLKSNGKKELKIQNHLLIGGLAGMLGQTVAYPFDTVRHRMQLEGVAKGIPTYYGTSQALYSIFTKEGFRAIYIGLTINYWKTIPANAVAFVVYDLMKNWLEIA